MIYEKLDFDINIDSTLTNKWGFTWFLFYSAVTVYQVYNGTALFYNIVMRNLFNMVYEKLAIDIDSALANKWGFTWFLFYSAVTANLLIFNSGLSFVWTSPVLPQLLSNDTEINPLKTPITTIQISTIAALPSVGSAIGLIIMAKVINILGRKKSMFIVATSAAISFIAMGQANHIYIYYICLFISGLSLGGICIAVPLYNVEIAEDKNRGKLGCFLTLAVPCGSLYSYILGSIFSVKWFTTLCAIPALLHLPLSIMLEESPVYLTSKRKQQEALNSLQKLRGHKNYTLLEQEYRKIEEFVQNDKKIKQNGPLDLFRSRESRKAFFLCLTVNLSMQTCGVSTVTAFAGPIFNEANTNLSGNSVAILLGIVSICVYLVTTFSVDKWGRRQLMLLSTFGCSFFMFILGLYFYLVEKHSSLISSIRWLPVTCIICFMIAFALGIGSLPVLLLAELFPCDLRATAMATIYVSETIASFIVLSSFPLIKAAYGTHCAIWLHSMITMMTFTIVYLFLPETKCKSFAEIEKLLSN